MAVVPQYAVFNVNCYPGAQYLSGRRVYHGPGRLSLQQRVADVCVRCIVDASGDDRLLYLVSESASTKDMGLNDGAYH